MLDIKWIINNPEEADKSFKKRGLKPLANKLIKMSESRSQVFVKLENLLEQRIACGYGQAKIHVFILISYQLKTA